MNVLNLIAGAIMGLFGGLLVSPLNSFLSHDLKKKEIELQNQLEIIIKTRELKLEHELEKMHSKFNREFEQMAQKLRQNYEQN